MSNFDEIRSLDDAYVMPTYGRLPVAFVRGDGARLWDTDGNEYLDFLSGLAVTSLGHANAEIAEAVQDQARTLVHVSNLYHNELQPRLAATLDRLLGGGGKAFFGNSGAEANECAIKLVRRYGQARGGPERYHVVTAMRSFHGRTLATLAATGQPEKQERFAPMPEGFRHVAYGDVDALAGALDGRVCAVMLEAVQGEGGVNPAPEGYLEAVAELCDEREALLVVDEVQTGLGRTGAWFAFQHAGIRPDVVTVAKALGNGVPIGACWARGEAADAFAAGDHATTFGGQPLAARAALTVLEIMEREDVPGRAARAGKRLADGLGLLEEVVGVRGRGLLLAAQTRADAGEVAKACLDAGLVVNGMPPDSIRFAPPLLVSDDEIDEALRIFAEVVA